MIPQVHPPRPVLGQKQLGQDLVQVFRIAQDVVKWGISSKHATIHISVTDKHRRYIITFLQKDFYK
jgi:hypothetical protein